MTRRTVVWVSDAETELAGSVLVEGLRALDAPPLRVLFEILDDDAMVRVLKVKRTAQS